MNREDVDLFEKLTAQLAKYASGDVGALEKISERRR